MFNLWFYRHANISLNFQYHDYLKNTFNIGKSLNPIKSYNFWKKLHKEFFLN